jgi:hypothetical protein
MSYSAGEALILTRVQAITNYSASNTSRGDWGILNSGKGQTYAIIRPGPFVRMWEGSTSNIATWTTIVEIWQRYIDDGTTLTNLEANVANVIAGIDIYKRMGDQTGLMIDFSLTSGSEVLSKWERGGNGPAWLSQELSVTWREEVDVTYSD